MNSLNLERRPVVEQCDGCDRIEGETKTCGAFAFPSAKWRLGPCSLATHIKIESKAAEKIRVGQQKQKQKKK
ncbi:MAG: PxxKW family cysteine-rich protein [Candidatus Adiutrix sp.]|nr:PxxKW family cysteine-rich protein [Candidatus Adiutrix sp.]